MLPRLTVACAASLTVALCVSAGAQEPADPSAGIAAVRALGAQALPLAQNDPRLDVAFHLADRKIGDGELAALDNLNNVAVLNLRGTEITDAGLAHVGKQLELVKLHLEKTKVTDAGLAHLVPLKKLEYLNLYGTTVTDAAVDHLVQLPALKRVYLWQTQVSDAGVAKLKQALPSVTVVRGVEMPPAAPAEAPAAPPAQ